MLNSQEFYRIQKLPPYVFAVINEMKAKARAAQQDVIALGMGNPYGATPRIIVNKMIEAARNPRNHRYSQSKGIAKLREEIVKRYKGYYDVDIDPAQSDHDVRGPRFFSRDRRPGTRARVDDRARFRLRRPLFRRLQGAQHSASPGRERSRRGDLLDVEELQHGRLAHRVLPRQPQDDRRVGAHQELSRLRSVPAAADRRHHRAAGMRGRYTENLRSLPQAPRRAGDRSQARRLA